jgi:hypothetical protein
MNGLMIFNTSYEKENLCWLSEDRLPKTRATGRQEYIVSMTLSMLTRGWVRLNSNSAVPY